VDLAERLLDAEQRETDGSRTLSRFDFQGCWGLFKIIELYKENKNFAVAFEFHDDIVVFPDWASKKSIEFFQIKGKEKVIWNFSELFGRKKLKKGEKKPSVVGNMYANKIKFQTNDVHLGFVSNNAAWFCDGVNYITCAANASDEDKNKIIDSLLEELGSFSESDLGILHFHLTEFGVNGYDRHIKGTISDLLNWAGGMAPAVDVETFFLMFSEKCRHKSKKLADLSSISDLVASKFITFSDFSGWVDDAKRQISYQPTWWDYYSRIPRLPLAEERARRRAWSKYTTDALNVRDAVHKKIRDEARRILSVLPAHTDDLNDLIEEKLEELMVKTSTFTGLVDDNYIRAALAYEFLS
jgi:hypothetical protein